MNIVSGSGMCKVGFTGVYAPRIMAGTDQKNSYVVLSFMAQRSFPMVQTVLRTLVSAVTVHCQVVDVLFVLGLRVPQVQFLEKMVDVPVVCNVRC